MKQAWERTVKKGSAKPHRTRAKSKATENGILVPQI